MIQFGNSKQRPIDRSGVSGPTRCLAIAQLLFIACLLLPAPAKSAAPETISDKKTIHFSCLAAADSRYFARLEKLYRSAFSELGYGFQMTSLTEPEILLALSKQSFDGDCARIAQYFEKFFSKHYDLLATSTFNMKVNIYGHKEIEKLDLNELNIVVQPFSGFIPKLARLYDINIVREINAPSDAWPLLQQGKVNGYLGIASLFPKDDPAVQQLNIGPEYTLSHYPVYPVLSKRFLHIKSPLERVLLRHIRSSAALERAKKNKAAKSQPLPSVSSRTIVFGCPVSPNTGVFNNLVDFYSEAFERLGYKFQMIGMSRDREANELLHGMVDGSCGRINIPVTDKNPPIRVPVSISEDDFEIWSHKKGSVINTLEDIPKGSKVAYRQSLLTANEIARASHLNFIPKKVVEETLESLNQGQSDYIVDLQIQVDTSLHNISLAKPIYYRGRIGRVQVVPYLSQKRRKLLHPLTRELRTLLGGNKVWADTIYPKSQRK